MGGNRQQTAHNGRAAFSIAILLLGVTLLALALHAQPHLKSSQMQPLPLLSGSGGANLSPLSPGFQTSSGHRYEQRRQPQVNVNWGPVRNMSNNPGADEPGGAMHPTNPSLAVSGGNVIVQGFPQPQTINNTTDGGNTWQQRMASAQNGADGSATWLAANINGGLSALFTYLQQGGSDNAELHITRSTDGGVTWAPITTNIHQPGFQDDREYLWTDHNPASPYYGRVYVTQATGSPNTTAYNSIAVRFSTDEGVTWSPINTLVDPTELAQGLGNNNYASLAIEPDGSIVAAWHRGRCCFDDPTMNVPNRAMWSRSTDGGVTFPISSTAYTVPVSQSISFVSHSPGGFKWTDAPNITADPGDGTLYAVWVALRQPNMNTTAAVYLSRGTPDATIWTAPVVVDDGQPDRYQFMPWVQVSPDHTVHITYGAAVDGNNSVAQFYVQSTDRGQTFSAPYLLSDGAFLVASFLGDYNTLSIGGITGNSYSIFSTWTQTYGGVLDQFGRIGVVSLSTSTSTPTSTGTGTTTPTPPATQTTGSTGTPTVALTFAVTGTSTRASSSTSTAVMQASPTLCNIQFSDVPVGSTFYSFIRCLACKDVIGGYADGTYRPNNNITRGQISKMVSNAANYQDPIPSDRQTYEDVPQSSTFWLWIERLNLHGVMSGYSCGVPGETCVPPGNRPYFRWANNATRAQLSKIASNAANFQENHTEQTFEDVPPSDPFYIWIERLASRNIIGGYNCGGPGEPCMPPQNRPYFRLYNSVTRGQASKIVAITFFPNCQTPGRRYS